MDKGYKEVLEEINRVKNNNLDRLDLSDYNLKELPKEIFKLKNLKELYLDGDNDLEFPKNIIKFKNLKILGASDLSYFPKEILELKNLKRLYLIYGDINQIPNKINQLKNLQELDLYNNNLFSLPKSLLDLKNLSKLKLSSNPKLDIPNEILETKNPKTILNYYFNLKESQTKELAEAKVLFVGQGGVGKTSLIKRLIDNSFDKSQEMTRGIEIEKLYANDLTLNMWDFGGQEIMHSTHQFFLTKRSLYVLVLSARADDELKRTEYWLKLISSFGGNSPVIIVLNKVDDGNKEIDENRLIRKYPQIKKVIKTSAQENLGIDKLKETILEESNKLEHVKEVWIKEWFEIKNYLEEQKDNGMDFIHYSKIEKLCEEKKIDKTSQEILIEYLHDLGVILNFNDKNLKDTNVLNPRWVTDGVYKIINSQIIKNGVLTIDNLNSIFENDNKYPKEKLPFIIEMMKKFELLFDFRGNYLIPELLPTNEPKLNFDFKENLLFIYNYDYLPTSIISRFMTRANRLILDDFFWKNGVVLKYRDITALILLDSFDKTISIFIDGDDKKELLTMIRHQINDINSTLNSLKIIQKVVKDGVKISFEHLLKLRDREIKEFFPENADKTFKVNEILDSIIDWDREKDISSILNNTKDKISNYNKIKQKDILADNYLICETSEDIFNLEEKVSLPYAIKQFKIENYQSIKSLSIEDIAVDSKWVFITGYNGAGKSAILQALAFGLSGVDKIDIDKDFKVSIELKVENSLKLNNIFYIGNYWNRPNFKLDDFASYGASRLSISDNEEITNNKHLFESESKLSNIEDWIIKKELEALKGDKQSKRVLKNTIDLLTKLLPDIDKIEIDGSDILYYEQNSPVNINQLSHGHKSIVGMIGDLILRLIDINPNIKDFSEFKAIVFIDEFETHLHPIWQIEFVEKLSKFFPNIQFWTTTHSPLPFIKAPKGSTVLKVNRDEISGTTIAHINLDISTLSPDTILTSPFFDVETLISPNIGDKEFRSERSYKEILDNDGVDEFIRVKLKSLNLDESLLNELKD